MLHNVDLILTLAGGLSAALVLGFITQKLRMSPIVGYLLAGIIVGPYSPGFVADADTASQCAEIGAISSVRSRKVNPSKAVCVERTAVGNTHVSVPHADRIGNATVSEHCPTQETSCTVKILFSDIIFSPFRPPDGFSKKRPP